MIRQSPAFEDFLDFSCAINDETRKKLFNITDTHPVLKNHPAIQRMQERGAAFISISAITQINEEILKHSVTLAKTAGSSDEMTCLRAIMEQNVLIVASTSLNALMTEQFRDSIQRLSKILDTMNTEGSSNNDE
jgi:hypothetical protein